MSLENTSPVLEEFTGSLRDIVEEIRRNAAEGESVAKKTRKERAKETVPRKPYVCKICGQIGHNKRRCPARNI